MQGCARVMSFSKPIKPRLFGKPPRPVICCKAIECLPFCQRAHERANAVDAKKPALSF